MARFEAALRQAEAALDLPAPLRARILVEMAADLEALFEAYRARGLSEQEAAARASAALGVGGEAAQELTDLHRPPYQRWTAHLTERGRNAVERTVVTVMSLAVLAAGIAGLATTDTLRDPAPLSRVLVLLGAVGAGVCVSLVFRLFLTQEPRNARLGLGVVGWIAIAAPVVALMAVVRELDALASRMIAADTTHLAAIAPSLRRAAHAATVGTLVSLSAFLAWFHLRRRHESLTRAEAELAAVADSEGVAP